MYAKKYCSEQRLEPTYEGLKLLVRGRIHNISASLEPTYEGLKHPPKGQKP